MPLPASATCGSAEMFAPTAVAPCAALVASFATIPACVLAVGALLSTVAGSGPPVVLLVLVLLLLVLVLVLVSALVLVLVLVLLLVLLLGLLLPGREPTTGLLTSASILLAAGVGAPGVVAEAAAAGLPALVTLSALSMTVFAPIVAVVASIRALSIFWFSC